MDEETDLSFRSLWKFATRHGQIVQDYSELEYVFNLINGCESYLEVGTAEGNSLYVLAHALRKDAKITYVDFGEEHTKATRQEVLDKLSNPVHGFHADSHNMQSIARANMYGPYDVVLIDAGHTYEDVVLDAVMYGPMAKKFLIFHDVQLPDVDKAFNWYCRYARPRNVHKFVKSEHYGYGIIQYD